MPDATEPTVSEIFDPSAWRPVPGFDYLTDLTYHRAVEHGTVRIAFDRPEVRNAFRPHTVDELLRVLEHAADVAGDARVLQHPEQLIDSAGAERVAHLRPVERDPHGAVLDRPVVGQVLQVLEPRHLPPGRGVEQLGDGALGHAPEAMPRPRAEPSAPRFRPEPVEGPTTRA